ncbi:uncharacterized protein B0I36DRAFT_416970 [Microdochium trichocladiopsis]|uniref:Uncharacterized protein n=1 Tax=Microdochium trichocladiopsis TaxID=1682393 RepID=A0A9P8XYR1_9PEZI|nr:uncharacterized protein B0I36DRAFT_416970 [Microdochium trichocladiopsis]KAH7025009.1 hypothetical protein B0I36DRAFT_416970 [Microdochium trichocladiopsis]
MCSASNSNTSAASPKCASRAWRSVSGNWSASRSSSSSSILDSTTRHRSTPPPSQHPPRSISRPCPLASRRSATGDAEEAKARPSSKQPPRRSLPPRRAGLFPPPSCPSPACGFSRALQTASGFSPPWIRRASGSPSTGSTPSAAGRWPRGYRTSLLLRSRMTLLLWFRWPKLLLRRAPRARLPLSRRLVSGQSRRTWMLSSSDHIVSWL